VWYRSRNSLKKNLLRAKNHSGANGMFFFRVAVFLGRARLVPLITKQCAAV